MVCSGKKFLAILGAKTLDKKSKNAYFKATQRKNNPPFRITLDNDPLHVPMQSSQ
jgi:hypothetical protein